jgi:hypothetical protein
MVQVVLPNDANALGFILGGTVMHLIDIAAAIACHRHTRSLLVTAAVGRPPVPASDQGRRSDHPQGAVTCAFTPRSKRRSTSIRGNADRTTAADQSRVPDFVARRVMALRVPVPPLLLDTRTSGGWPKRRRPARARLRKKADMLEMK